MRDIKGYEGLYAITSCGRVWSYKSKKFLKLGKRKDGYLFVILCKDSKRKNYLVHRLVAEAYLPNQDNLPQVNHKDENKANNALPNLEWCDAAYNSNYSKAKKVICLETGQVFESIKAAEDFVKCGHICECCKGKRKTTGGYHWRYYEDEE